MVDSTMPRDQSVWPSFFAESAVAAEENRLSAISRARVLTITFLCLSEVHRFRVTARIEPNWTKNRKLILGNGLTSRFFEREQYEATGFLSRNF